MEGLQQLEHEIQRHLALAQLCSGPIRDGHLEAARQLAVLREFFQEDDMSKREKGATGLDRLCHKFYELPKGVGLQVDRKCRRCGGSLMAYYCEERLYLIVCEDCNTMALTKACAPQVAANLTLAEKDSAIRDLLVRAESAELLAGKAKERLSSAIDSLSSILSWFE